MRYRDYDGGYPPLPSDVLPDVTSADDNGYANQGYDRAKHVKHLRTAHFHAKEAVKCLLRALDGLDEDLGPEQADIEPTLFDEEVDDNPEGEAARRALAILRNLAS